MKESTRIKIWQKIVIVLIAVLIIGFFLPNVARAEDGENILLAPIKALFVTIGDGIMSLMQQVILGMDTSIIECGDNTDFWVDFIFWACIILVVVGAVLATVFIPGVGAAFLVSVVGYCVLIVGGYSLFSPVIKDVVGNMMGDTLYLPIYDLSPYEIFSNKISMLDINFFDPKENDTLDGLSTGEYKQSDEIIVSYKFLAANEGYFENTLSVKYPESSLSTGQLQYASPEYYGITPYTLKDEEVNYYIEDDGSMRIEDANGGSFNLGQHTSDSAKVDEIRTALANYNNATIGSLKTYFVNSEKSAKNIEIPSGSIEDGANFSVSFDGTVVNIDNPSVYVYSDRIVLNSGVSGRYALHCKVHTIKIHFKDSSGNTVNEKTVVNGISVDVSFEEEELRQIFTPSRELKSTISKWYVTLRNIAIVCLMSILLYIAIRIILSSVASEKAKYKQMLIDWVVAMCLLFFMHYIMLFSITIVDKITEIVDAAGVDTEKTDELLQENNIDPNLLADKKQIVDVFRITDDEQNKEKNKVKIAYDKLVGKDVPASEDTLPNSGYFLKADGSQATGYDDAEILVWPVTNYLGQARMELQFLDNNSNATMVSIGWTIVYIVLIVFTIIYFFVYLKRVIYMAFLTLIAPMVALTYPIDKMNDGQAQAFNRWLKEYIFNLLIQPLHLLLYFILIGAASTFASENPVYVIVAMGFFIPAEKLLKSFFGFEKSQTAGGGMVATGLMMTGLNKVLHPRPPKHDSDIGRGGKGEGESTTAKKSLRQKNNFDPFAVLSGGSGDDTSTPSGGITSPIGGGSIASNIKNAAASTLSSGAKKKSVPGGNTPSFTPSSTLNIGVNNPKTTPKLSPNTSGKKAPSQFRRLRRASSATLRKFGENATTRYKSKRPLSRLARKGIRTAAGAYLGLTLGSGALLGSIVTGDPSTIASATAGAAGAGYAFGRNIVSENPSNKGKEYLEAAKDAYYTEDEKQQKEEEKQIKEMRQNTQLKYALQDKYGASEAREMLKEGGQVEKLMRNGIYEQDDILTARDLIDENIARDENEAAAMIQLADRYGDFEGGEMTEDQRNKQRDTMFADHKGRLAPISDQEQAEIDRRKQEQQKHKDESERIQKQINELKNQRDTTNNLAVKDDIERQIRKQQKEKEQHDKEAANIDISSSNDKKAKQLANETEAYNKAVWRIRRENGRNK